MVKLNKSLKKELTSTIKVNIKKFISLTLIIFLGVAFYVGMKSNAPVLENTMIKYFKDYKYMDIQIISPIGLTDEELNDIKNEVSEINIIEGGFQEDVVVSLKNIEINEHQDYVLSVNSYNLDKQLNKVRIVKGRELKKSNEILVDASMEKFGYVLGDTIKIKHNNIKEQEYKIVGFVRSPYFISIERGTSTLLNGKIDHFVYILEENFNYDGLYNRGNVVLKTDKKDFTDEYNEFVKSVVKKIENASVKISKERKEKFILEKEEEYNKALQEYEASSALALNELNNAKSQIEEAETKINEAEAKILTDKEVDLYLDNAKTKLDAAKVQLDSSKATLDMAKQMISGVATPDTNLQYLKSKLSAAKEALQTTNNEINNITNEISVKQRECSSIEDTTLKETCNNSLASLNERLTSLNSKVTTIKNEIIQINNLIIYFENFGSETESIGSYISKMEKEYNSALYQYNVGLKEYNSAKSNMKNQMKEAKVTIEEKKNELNNAKKELKIKEEEVNNKLGEAKNKLAKAKKQIETLKTTNWYVLDRSYKADYTQYYDDVQRVENISKILPFVFFIVAALVTGSSITRLVKEERMKIGILKSLGYSNKHVLIKYLYYTGLATIIGIISGLIFGIFVFPKVFASVYTLLYFIPPLKYTFEIKHVIIAIIAALSSSVLVAYLVTKGSLRENPYYLLRPKVEKRQHKTLLEKNKTMWKKLSFMKKVTYRNLFRSIGKSLMTILGIAGCTALIIAGFGTREALAGIVYKQYGDIFKLNGEYFYKDGLTRNEMDEEQKRVDELSEVKSTMLAMSKLVHFDVGNDKKLQTTMIVPKDLKELKNFIDFENAHGKGSLELTDDGVIITEKLARLLNVKSGDEAKFIDNDNNVYTVKVIGVCKNYIYHYIYMTKEYYKTIYGVEPENNLLIAKFKDNVSESNVNKKIISSGLYSNMLSLLEAEKQYNNIMEKFNLVIIVIIICAALLAFVVLYNLAKINISERTREIATLKVLGFKNKQVNNYINREMKLLTLLGVLLGIFFGKVLTSLVIRTCEVDTIMFDTTPAYVSYIYGVLLTLIFSSVINRIVKKDLKDIKMVESLKLVE